MSLQLTQAITAGGLDGGMDSSDDEEEAVAKHLDVPQEADEEAYMQKDDEAEDEDPNGGYDDTKDTGKKSKSTFQYAVKAVNKSGKLATKAVSKSGKLATKAVSKSGKLATQAVNDPLKLATNAVNGSGKLATKAVTKSGQLVTKSGKYTGKAVGAVVEAGFDVMESTVDLIVGSSSDEINEELKKSGSQNDLISQAA